MSLYRELKRRNVFRVAIAYLAGSWLLIEIAETIFPLYGFGDTPARIVVTLLAIGFPLFLVFSWVFEITPEGLKLEKDIKHGESITPQTGKKLDHIIIVLLALALGYFAFDKFVLDPAQDAKIAETAAQAGAEQALAEAKESALSDKSIAVLPFTDMSLDKDQEYFADGLSETLIHVLAQVSGLKVTAKTSSFYFKSKNMDVGEIARELHVGTLLVGSVQKSGDRVRVIAQLINAADSTHRWSKSFDRELEDIFAVQDEIAQQVVEALKITLLESELERLEQRYKPMVEAYEQVIMGRHEMGKHTATSLADAERYFKRAIELDPGYSLAYVGLADTYDLQVRKAGIVFEDSLQRRQSLVETALELDPLSGEAYRARASLNIDWQIKISEENFSAVEEDILKAIQLSPNDAAAHHWYSGLLSDKGLFEEALVQVRMAAELDPISPIIQLDVARATWDVGRAEEALTLIRRNIERTPEFLDNYETMAQFQSHLGQLGEAQRWFREARKMNPEGAYGWNRECLGLLALGDAPSAEDCIKQLIEAHPENPISLIMPMGLHAYQGEWGAAKAILELLWERLPGWHPYTRILAFLTAMQGDLERARKLMAESFPWMLEDGLELAASDLNSAIVFAAILNATGEIQRRDMLLRALEERIATLHRTHGILDVYIHAMRGDRDRAIAALREAIDIGWRVSWSHLDSSWWLLQDDWRLAILHQDPEFIAMVEELEADIEAQRQWYEENKDKPLF